MITAGSTRLVVQLQLLGAFSIAAFSLRQGSQAVILVGLTRLASVLLPLVLALQQECVTLGAEVENHQHERRVRGLHELLVDQRARHHGRHRQPQLLAAVPPHVGNNDEARGRQERERGSTSRRIQERQRGSEEVMIRSRRCRSCKQASKASNGEGCGAANRRSIFFSAHREAACMAQLASRITCAFSSSSLVLRGAGPILRTGRDSRAPSSVPRQEWRGAFEMGPKRSTSRTWKLTCTRPTGDDGGADARGHEQRVASNKAVLDCEVVPRRERRAADDGAGDGWATSSSGACCGG